MANGKESGIHDERKRGDRDRGEEDEVDCGEEVAMTLLY